ncbi:MAG: DegT/DnrJ/EryC1/StrS family aminotransferase [Nevskiales bacterium]
MSTDKKPIPVLDLNNEITLLWDELSAAVQGVLRSGAFILGPEVQKFEAEVQDYLGVKHAIGLNSGTDALVIALRAMGINPGDEVITSSFSFFATAEAIEIIGAKAIFVDIDPASFNLDVNQVEAKITAKTRALLPVHLYGQAADMGAVLDIARRHKLKVLEDVAQAFGSDYQGKKAGAIGDAGAHSFYPTKNLGAYGDGGMITTNDDEIAKQVRILRDHGSPRKYHHVTAGYNSRLDSIQAAILRIKLKHIDAWNDARRSAARHYTKLLGAVPGITPPAEAGYSRHVYHQYTIRVANGQRDRVREALTADGIASMIYYPEALHQAPFFAARAKSEAASWAQPRSERACQEVLSLPIGPRLSSTDVERVADVIKAAL